MGFCQHEAQQCLTQTNKCWPKPSSGRVTDQQELEEFGWCPCDWDREQELNSQDTVCVSRVAAKRTVRTHLIHESRHSFWTEAILRAAASRRDKESTDHRLLQCHSCFEWELTALFFTLQSTLLWKWSKRAPACWTGRTREPGSGAQQSASWEATHHLFWHIKFLCNVSWGSAYRWLKTLASSQDRDRDTQAPF